MENNGLNNQENNVNQQAAQQQAAQQQAAQQQAAQQQAAQQQAAQQQAAQQQAAQQQAAQQQANYNQQGGGQTFVYDQNDIQNNKALAVVSYIGILFFLPLLAAPESKFARFHANQALLLHIATWVVCLAFIIPILGWIVGGIALIAIGIFWIMSIVRAGQGVAKEIPIIGHIRIIR